MPEMTFQGDIVGDRIGREYREHRRIFELAAGDAQDPVARGKILLGIIGYFELGPARQQGLLHLRAARPAAGSIGRLDSEPIGLAADDGHFGAAVEHVKNRVARTRSGMQLDERIRDFDLDRIIFRDGIAALAFLRQQRLDGRD